MKNEKLKIKIKNTPDLKTEQRLWRRGFSLVAGLDEAGRGPLAGPVTAAAVMVRQFSPASPWLGRGRAIFAGLVKLVPLSGTNGAGNSQFSNKSKILNSKILKSIKDSKRLSAKQREQWYKILTNHPDIKYGVGIVSEKVIDKINILEATKLAMKKALEDLGGEPDFLLLDGNFLLSGINGININQQAMPRGDEKIWSCAAASIIAKVTRDRLMFKYHRKYPRYGFDCHKGYGTRRHFAAIKKHGPCKIHRFSFAPCKTLTKT